MKKYIFKFIEDGKERQKTINAEGISEGLVKLFNIREKIKEYDKWIKEGGDYTESLEAQRYALKELLEEN